MGKFLDQHIQWSDFVLHLKNLANFFNVISRAEFSQQRRVVLNLHGAQSLFLARFYNFLGKFRQALLYFLLLLHIAGLKSVFLNHWD
jgi:hypothetical protein